MEYEISKWILDNRKSHPNHINSEFSLFIYVYIINYEKNSSVKN